MTSIIQKFSLLGCLGLSIAACSSVNLDNNADKIQTQPTSPDQKQLITVHQVDANGVGASIGTVSFQQTPKGLLITPALGKLFFSCCISLLTKNIQRNYHSTWITRFKCF